MALTPMKDDFKEWFQENREELEVEAAARKRDPSVAILIARLGEDPEWERLGEEMRAAYGSIEILDRHDDGTMTVQFSGPVAEGLRSSVRGIYGRITPGPLFDRERALLAARLAEGAGLEPTDLG